MTTPPSTAQGKKPSEWLNEYVIQQSKRFTGEEVDWLHSNDEVKIEAIVQYLDSIHNLP